MNSKFQSRSRQIGNAYEYHVEAYLASRGFLIIPKEHSREVHESGVQFDIQAIDHNGLHVGVECKAGIEESKGEPGLRRSDNIWKVGGYLHQLENWQRQDPRRTVPRFLVFTTHMPHPGTRWAKMLQDWALCGQVEFHQLDLPGDDADWSNEAALPL